MITDQGQDNIIEGAESFEAPHRIRITGHRNRIVFGAGFKYGNAFNILVKSNDTLIRFGTDCAILGNLTIIHNSHHCRIEIGDRLKVNGSLWVSCAGPGRKIRIGDDCLVASARMRTSDHHKIFSKTNDKLLNPPGDITVGDRVWLGEDSLLLKGTAIGSGSVIGARSLVSKTVPPEVLAAGNPVRIIREEIRWEY